MKSRLLKSTAALLCGALFSSCATTYDRNGNRQQTVTPEGAVIGAAAIGLIGYSIAKNRYKDRHNSHYRRHNNRGYYDDGYYRGYGECR